MAWRRSSISNLHNFFLSTFVCTPVFSFTFHHFTLCPSLVSAYLYASVLFPSSTPQHSREASNISNTVSASCFNLLLLCEIFISLWLSTSFAPQESRETTYKSDPGALRWIEKRQDALPPSLYTDLQFLLSNKSNQNPYQHTWFLSVFPLLILAVGLLENVWGPRTDMGSKLLSEMFLLMCKHAECEDTLSIRTLNYRSQDVLTLTVIKFSLAFEHTGSKLLSCFKFCPACEAVENGELLLSIEICYRISQRESTTTNMLICFLLND